MKKELLQDNDVTASTRKQDHIALAFESQVASKQVDNRFYYEPLLAGHPNGKEWGTFSFLNKQLRAPIWISSMTGGTEWAKTINNNLARLAGDLGLGMGLGSCRSLLSSNEYLKDFDVRSLIGDEQPLYANLGIAQIEQLLAQNKVHLAKELVDKLSADGLIIHINPLQEWLQPEGDRFTVSPLETITDFMEKCAVSVIIKEVGQGMGRESLKALLQLPIDAIDFAANGGTNFAKLELLRSTPKKQQIYAQLANIGHTAEDMVDMTNELFISLGNKVACKEIIISGGVNSFLDGYYCISKAKPNAIYGQASAFLKHARGSYEELYEYAQAQIEGLVLAKQFLKVRNH